jgi:S1-C subfamily serine protease
VTLEILRQGTTLAKQVEVVERVEPDFRFFDMISSERNLVPRLGILGLDLDNDSRLLLATPPRAPKGVIVAALAADTGLLGEGFRPGDILYALNGRPVESLQGLKEQVGALTYGQPAVFQLEREGQLRYLLLEVE